MRASTHDRITVFIPSKKTKPELVIRKSLHGLGFHYRTHCKDLPGSPDIVLPKYKAAIQIKGCFWHGHDCHIFKTPKTHTEYWQQKISRNQARNVRSRKALQESDWRLMVVWECRIRDKTN